MSILIQCFDDVVLENMASRFYAGSNLPVGSGGELVLPLQVEYKIESINNYVLCSLPDRAKARALTWIHMDMSFIKLCYCQVTISPLSIIHWNFTTTGS